MSRAPLRSLLLRRPALPDPVALQEYVRAPGAVAGVLIGHTHFDHALDAPALARRFNTRVYGSSSLRQLMALHGLAERAVVVDPGRTYELGPFTVRFVPSRHAKLILGRKVPFDGPLTCDDLHALAPGAYKCGPVYGIRIEVAGMTLYHQGSADLDDAALGRQPVDVFLAGRRRPRAHPALLGADPPAAGPARRGPEPLRRLLPPAPQAPAGPPRDAARAAARRDRRRLVGGEAGGARTGVTPVLHSGHPDSTPPPRHHRDAARAGGAGRVCARRSAMTT